MDILLATHNEHKKQEIQAIFPKFITIKSLSDIGFDEEIDETAITFNENALIKAKAGFEFSKIPTFSDDSGLVIPSINYEPGVYSARYAGTGNSSDNIEKVLFNLKGIEDRSAYFICVICYFDGIEIHYFEGKILGKISTEIKGENGFGYDPIFIPNNYDISFAEIPTEVKNTISHRALALKKFITFLNNKKF